MIQPSRSPYSPLPTSLLFSQFATASVTPGYKLGHLLVAAVYEKMNSPLSSEMTVRIWKQAARGWATCPAASSRV